MAFCKNCGTQLMDESLFCHSCGLSREVAREGEEGDGTSGRFDTVVREKNAYGAFAVEDLPQGHVIDDRYEVKARVGQGGFGVVYRVYDRKMEMDKALKVLRDEVVHDSEAMETLRREAVTMARLNHENIVRVYDFKDKGPIRYLDMEFVNGQSLSDIKLASPGKRLSEARVRQFAVSVAEGLAYAHKKRVIHRDIKPRNILVSKKGEVKITDFGIAEVIMTSKTRIGKGAVSGTPVYMSPEQIKGRNVGKEADIYSFGILLYELLSGKPPFHTGALEHQILHEAPLEIEDVSVKINGILQKCLAKHFSSRYRNFGQVLAALAEPDGAPAEDEAAGKEEPVKEPPRRREALRDVGREKEPAAFKEPRLTVKMKRRLLLLSLLVAGVAVMVGGGLFVLGQSRLYVRTEPQVALVEFSGFNTPFRQGMRLKPGVYGIRVTAHGHFPEERMVSVRKGEDTEVEVKLDARPGRLFVKVEPSGASVRLLRKKERYYNGMELKPGAYDIEVASAGYLSKKTRVTLLPGEDSWLSVRLKRKSGRFYVLPSPSDARVRILNIRAKYRDGMELGPGKYHVEVSKGGYLTKKRWVTFRADGDKTVSMVLEKKSRKRAAAAKKERSWREPVTGMVFVTVPGGCFSMGSRSGDADERRVHKVCLSPFWIGRYEVTVGQYLAFVRETRRHYPEWLEPGGRYHVRDGSDNHYRKMGAALRAGDHPIVGVSWKDATAFAEWLSRKSGEYFRLPTEAEWEYAARSGGRRETYSGGGNIGRVAWYSGNSGNRTHRVGTKKGNGLGIYDMSGNVWEWCGDWKGPYPSGPVTDPVGSSLGARRVARGGSWFNEARNCRTTVRDSDNPSYRNDYLGFRLVRIP